jgi:hypothetical protein
MCSRLITLASITIDANYFLVFAYWLHLFIPISRKSFLYLPAITLPPSYFSSNFWFTFKTFS